LRRQGAQDKPWEQFHKSFAHRSVADETQSGGAESLKAVCKDNGIEREECNDVAQAGLLESVVKFDDIVHLGRVHPWKDQQRFLNDPVDLGARCMR
jgi:hypothetical protein